VPALQQPAAAAAWRAAACHLYVLPLLILLPSQQQLPWLLLQQ
jgi:hypothetical protein